MKIRSALLLAALLSVSAFAQERVTLSTPVKADPGATVFRVSELNLNVEGHSITVRLREADGAGAFVRDGHFLAFGYVDAEADALLSSLNTANLSIKSLQRRIIEKLVADGKVAAGTISGVPQ